MEIAIKQIIHNKLRYAIIQNLLIHYHLHAH